MNQPNPTKGEEIGRALRQKIIEFKELLKDRRVAQALFVGIVIIISLINKTFAQAFIAAAKILYSINSTYYTFAR